MSGKTSNWLVLLLSLSVSHAAFCAQKPKGWWCAIALGGEASAQMERTVGRDGSVHWVPRGSWTLEKVGKVIQALHAKGIPLNATYLTLVKDADAESLVKRVSERDDATLARFVRAAEYHYGHLGAAGYFNGIVFQELLLPNGSRTHRDQIIDVVRQLRQRSGPPRKAQFLDNTLPGFDEVSLEAFGTPMKPAYFWALMRNHSLRLNEINNRLAREEKGVFRIPGRWGAETIPLDRHQANLIGVALVEQVGFQLNRRPISVLRNAEVVALSLEVVGLPATVQDLKTAANQHFGSWELFVEAVKATRFNSFAQNSQSEIVTDLDGTGRYTTLRGGNDIDASAQLQMEEVLTQINTFVTRKHPRHSEVIRALVDHIIHSHNVLSPEELREFLLQSEFNVSADEVDSILGIAREALRPAA